MEKLGELEQIAFEGILEGVEDFLGRKPTEIEKRMLFTAYQTGLTVSKIINKSEPSLKLILN
jgi:hypothetical protein